MRRFFSIVLVTMLACAGNAYADTSIGYLIAGQGSAPAEHRVSSIAEQQFADVVRQHSDFSCGAAVLATLFRYAYGADVDEAQVLAGMLNTVDAAVVRERGFSLLDIKRYAQRVGLYADGYSLQPPALRDLRVPAIALLDISGYEHFVLVRKTDADWVYLADPALGNRRMRVADFVADWNGIVLVVVGAGYDPASVLAHPAPPPSTAELLAGVPLVATPATFAALKFSGVSSL